MDDDLRNQTRRALQGDPAAEARLLVLRRRRGELSGVALELLAYVGHAPALEAAGCPAPPADLKAWAQGLARWEPQLALVAALLAAERVLGQFEAAFPDDIRPRRALDLARRCLLSPTDANCDRALFAAADAFEAAMQAGEGAAHWAASAARTAAEVVPRAPLMLSGREGHPLLLEVGAALDNAARARGDEASLRGEVAAELARATERALLEPAEDDDPLSAVLRRLLGGEGSPRPW